jgi:galactokinase
MGDTKAFVASLNESIAELAGAWRRPFASERELIVSRAPGRLDLMGGIADYSGSLVLQWPIESAVHVALQRRNDRRLRIASLPETQSEKPRLFEIDLDELLNLGAVDYETSRARFAGKSDHWAAYIAGTFPILAREKTVSFSEGADILIKSGVPEGKGVASSAALEVASMQAVATAYDVPLAATELALLSQKLENLIVGAPCGVMDQMTAACAEKNRLLELRCQPANLLGTIPLPAEIEVWGLDSGIRHSVGGADYRTVRTAAFMGYRIIAGMAGLPVRTNGAASHLLVEDQRWNGYLANIAPEEFEREYARHLPALISGAEFLRQFDGITDRLSTIDPATEYPVLAATRHPIYENARVNRFAEILRSWQHESDAVRLGELMYESHASYSTCGLGSDGTDALVQLARNSLVNGVYGAKITGGGSGGTVAILGRRGEDEAIQQIARRYLEETGHQPAIISGSSPGASSFGALRIADFTRR